MNSSIAETTSPKRAKKLTARLSEWFILSAVTLLTLGGTATILGGFGKSQGLDLHDPILGFSFRHFMLLVGIGEIIAAFLCLFTNKWTWSLGFVVLLSANLAIYRIGLWTLGWQQSWGFLIDPLNFSLQTTDALMSTTMAFLLIGSVTTLWLRKGASQPEASDGSADLIKISCFFCGGRIQFSTKNVGQKVVCPHCQKIIVLRTPASLKMSCPSCGGHIEFSSHGLGQAIPCPHCTSLVTLQLSRQ